MNAKLPWMDASTTIIHDRAILLREIYAELEMRKLSAGVTVLRCTGGLGLGVIPLDVSRSHVMKGQNAVSSNE